MKKILLACQGISPDPSTLKYALDLASELRSELEIVEIIPSSSNTNKKQGPLGLIKSFMEDAMVAVTFAEHKEHEVAQEIIEQAMDNLRPFLKKIKNSDLKVGLFIRQGDVVKEILEYINSHKHIILTILSLKKGAKKINLLKKELDIPLVVVKA